MVVVSMLSLYLMNFFDRIYIRFTLGLNVISILVDFLWLIMYAGSKWSPSTISNNSIYQLGYMRFIVFFTIILIPLKIGLGFLLFKYRNTESKDKYLVSIGLMKIILNGNRSNPISKSLANHHLLAHWLSFIYIFLHYFMLFLKSKNIKLGSIRSAAHHIFYLSIKLRSYHIPLISIRFLIITCTCALFYL